ncbi:hypothetical protein LCGC14_1540160 [marine sediment metagenome]|uniref:ERF family protein n=1 Tax=marine sediment metagenome TaxID=412755 RepID=A0A0F9ITE0_9ZZZZ
MPGTTTEIIKAMVAVRKEVHIVAKSGKSKTQGYKYSELADYIGALKNLLEEHGLAAVTSIDNVQHHPPVETRSGGKLNPCEVQGTITLYHVSGESISAGITGYAQNAGDKAVYAAITGARKYALGQMFNLATSDDPESFPDADKRDKLLARRDRLPGFAAYAFSPGYLKVLSHF